MLELAGGDWAARLLPEQGGAFAALTWRGQEVLATLPPGEDPNASFAGAFLMAPWGNRLMHGFLNAGGQGWRMPLNRPTDVAAIHGLSRDRPWVVEGAGAGRAVLTQRVVVPPFDYAARLEVALAEDCLRLALDLTNLAAFATPMGSGWHPWFARRPGTRLDFAAGMQFPPDRLGYPRAAEPSLGMEDVPLADREGLDQHFALCDGALRIARPDLTLRLAASGAWERNLQVFIPRGSQAFCAEPMSHVPDARPGSAWAWYGALRLVEPGATLGAALTLAAVPAGV